ncbi:MAG: 16S rRNA (uracil(1498)-N(3))-methyltransferase [Pseudomonadota bacterium]
MTDRPKVRLYIAERLFPGAGLTASPEQSHYLTSVMRLGEGAEIAVFDGAGPEYRATISVAHRKKTVLQIGAEASPFQPLPDLWLLFAPIKKARTDFIVEKATEMGVSRIMPVFTDFTNSERLRIDRLAAHITEAVEQCGGTAVPEIDAPRKLADVISDWPNDRHLFFADEATSGAPKQDIPKGPAAILIGPEGGFSDEERTRLAALPQTQPLQLGPRILRADTAVVAALARWHAEAGDWT